MFFDLLKSRFFYWVVVSFGAGITFYFNALPYAPLVFACLGSLFMGCLFFWRYDIAKKMVMLFLFFTLGFVHIYYKTENIIPHFIEKPIKDTVVTGIITTVDPREDKIRLTLTLIDPPSSIPPKIRVNLSRKEKIPDHLEEGSTLKALVNLTPIMFQPFPGGLDLRFQAFYEGIGAYGYIKDIHTITPHQDDHPYLIQIKKLRHAIDEKFASNLSVPYSSIASALVTGNRGMIPADLRQNFVDAGIAHILAISGLHLSLIAGLIFFSLRFILSLFPLITEKYSIKKAAAFLTIIFTFFYLAISGFGVPAQRAFIMMTLSMTAIMADRPPISLRLLSFAAFFILILFPESLLSVSFQLSFAAVVALVSFYETGWESMHTWARHGGWIRTFLLYFGSIITTTCLASFATTFYTIHYFNRLTLQSVLGNLIAIPLTSILVMPFAFISSLLLPFIDEQSSLLYPFEISLTLLCFVADYVSSLPGAAILVPTPPSFYVMLVTCGGLWLFLHPTKKRFYGLFPIMMGIVLCFIPPSPMVLVSPKAIGYFDGEKLHLSSKTPGYDESFWMRHLGVSQSHFIDHPLLKITPQKIPHEQPLFLFANPWLLSKEKRKIAYAMTGFFVTNAYVSPYDLKKNDRDKIIIDREDLIEKGNHFIDLKKAPFPDVISIRDMCGKYPWCPQ